MKTSQEWHQIAQMLKDAYLSGNKNPNIVAAHLFHIIEALAHLIERTDYMGKRIVELEKKQNNAV